VQKWGSGLAFVSVSGFGSVLLCPPPAREGHFGIAPSVRPSVPWRSCLSYGHAGCLQACYSDGRCSVPARGRVFPALFDQPTRDAVSPNAAACRVCLSPKHRSAVIAKFHYTGLTGPARTRTDPHGLCRRPPRTQRSFAAKKSVRVRSGPCSGI